MRKTKCFIVLVVWILALAGWTPGNGGEELTYSRDIAPLIQEKCAECHRDGAGAPFPLTDYRSVKRKAGTIARVVEDRFMPPWHAVGGDVPLQGDRRLTEDEIAMFRAWRESGAQEGDPADLPPPVEYSDGWRLGEPDLILKMEEAYELPAEGPDIYRNFVIPTGLKKKRYLRAVEYHPSSPEVVHHALFYSDTSGRAREIDKADAETGFAEMPVGEGAGSSIGGWVPGTKPRPLPKGMAWTLPPGGDIVIQIHFHLSGKLEKEQSVIGLYFDGKPPTRLFTSIQLPPLFGAFSGVDLPPGEDNIEVSDTFELPVPVKAFGLSPHSHYRGKSLSLVAELPGGKSIKLLNIPEWDMNWQEDYRFEDEVALPAGTLLHSKIVWDNSATSPENPVLPPVRVRWGLESFDEMGSIDLFVVPEGKTKQASASLKILRARYREHITWKAGAHVLGPEKLSVFGDLRSKAIARFDQNGDGILGGKEREDARKSLKLVLP